MKNAIENPYSSRVVSEIDLDKMKSIVQENEKDSFSARFSGVIFFLTFALLPVLIIVSVLTEFSFIYTSVKSITNAVAMSWVAGIIFIIVIEGIKLGLGYKTFWFLVNNWFKEGVHYFYIFVLMFLVSGGAYIASAFCSIKGIPTTFEIFAEWIYNPVNEQLIKIDEQIAEARATKTDRGETTYKSTATIAELTIQRTAVLSEIQEDKIRFKERVKTIGTNFSFFGGGLEVLTLLSLLMRATYRKYSYLEIKDTEELDEVRKMINEKSVKKN